ncbi:sugar phosphate isomerase/epimerase [Balneolaceae bacterium ANBcel3]|nr:sugar phosphate isomerase/epimerase [Balneolaceae bacterium ANBcel3]
MSSCNSAPKTLPFGLQLWTLRDVIADDPQSVLRQVADYGYTSIESYEGPLGMFWGMGNNGFKQFMDDHGMKMVSSHANVFDQVEYKIEEMANIGVEYIVCPHIGDQGSIDAYKEMADRFNQIGKLAKEGGLSFAYHNHGYTFEEMDGVMPQDVLMEHTDPDLVEYQVDMYWVEITGQSTLDWLKKYPGRFTSCHIKDLANGDQPESTVLGTGTIDFPPILRHAKDDGMKHFIVEQEQYTNTTPLDAIRKNAEYMKNLRL